MSDIHLFFTNWAINSGVMDVNGIRWHWAFHEDPRFPNLDNDNQCIYDWFQDYDNGYYGPDYNFNDGDW